MGGGRRLGFGVRGLKVKGLELGGGGAVVRGWSSGVEG